MLTREKEMELGNARALETELKKLGKMQRDSGDPES